MAILRRRPDPPAGLPVPHEQPKSLIAAAARVNLEGKAWRSYKFGQDETWQQECWRLYDLVGELRFSANWVGSMLSRVRIYVAEVDKNGRVQKEVTDGKVAALSDTLFGGPPSKSEALRMLGVNLTIAGDAYIVGEGVDDAKSDKWRVVSCSELKRWGQRFKYVYPDGETETLSSNAIIIRVWTPHPRRYIWADSPTKAALPMLWEIERLTRYVFAQIDSRLVSAGLFPIPKETSFADMDPETGPAESLTDKLTQVGSASLRGEGTAAGVVPTFVEMPLEALGKLENIPFSSELSKQALDLRAEAIRRFALAMDMPPEVLTGTGDTNHWASWHVAESAIKTHIEPIMTRICEALTEAYLKPALKHLKKEPDRFVFWYDTAPLTVRPQRLEDTLNLYEKGIVGAETVLIAGDYHLSDAPEEEEDLRRFTRELMLRDPNLFQIPAVRKVAGYTDEILPPETVVTPQVQPGMPGAGPPPPPAPPTGIQPTGAPPPMPENSEAQNALGGPPAPKPPLGLAASATADPNDHAVANARVFVVADAAVKRAMELAGKRLLDRHNRNNWPGVAAQDLHTRIRVRNEQHARQLLSGSWDHLSVLAEHLDAGLDTTSLTATLDDYCCALLVQSYPHQSSTLGEVLRRKGFFRGQP